MFQSAILHPHRIETHRALELLSDYYSKLIKSQEKQLIIELERIIRILKSRFFQALIDIQEFYEITVLDGIKNNNLVISNSNILLNNWKLNETSTSLSDSIYDYYKNDKHERKCEHIEIILVRGETGLGFSIAGGIDNPHVVNDSRIYVTKIVPYGAADIDGRLRINDIIEQVNDNTLLNVTHSSAVEILKVSGDEVKLSIQRKLYSQCIQIIELLKEPEGFGFSIAGGVGNQHIPGENGIYITKIVDGGAAQLDGRLKVGQRLLAVQNVSGYRNLENVNHDEAVDAIKSSDDKIILAVIEFDDNDKKSNYPNHDFPVYEGVSNLFDSNSSRKKCIAVSQNTEDDSVSIKNVLNSSINQDNFHESVNQIILRRGSSGLGFNIIGGEDAEGIYVSYIMEGGPAATNGNLQKGDRIKSVNGFDFTNITHEEAATILKGSNDIVTITIVRNIEDFKRFESKLKISKHCRSEQSLNIGSIVKTTQKKTMHVRTLFEYDPKKDDDVPSHGLSFKFGDILHVTNASDDEWWLATKVFPENTEGYGIIPARKRWERKQRARERSVKFEGHLPVILDKQNNLDKRKKNYSFSRKFPFMKNKDDKLDDSAENEPFMLCYTQEDAKIEDPDSKEILYRVELPYMEELTLVYLEKDSDDDDIQQQLCGEDNVLTYENVQAVAINYTRPVVILGPMKDKINDDLISNYPYKFGSCVPHTTRPKRDNEVDGQDYYFVPSREEMEKDIQNHLFIEAGQYNENLYGTSIASVKEVASQGKHCILDVSGNAIKRLYLMELYPIALFIKVNSPTSIMNMNDKITEEQAKRIYYRSLRIEQEFGEYFTGIIKGDNYIDIYEQVKESITVLSCQHSWIPSKFLQV